MTEYKPILAFNSPFISEGIPSLADVLAQLETVEGLSPTRRRDLRSALTSIARLIGRRAEEVPANLNWLRIRVRRIHPAAHDLSKKRWSNIRSDALKALEVTGCSRMRADWLCPPSPAWQALLDRIADKHDLWKLTQLAQYCSALGIEPEDVRDAHIRGLTETLVRESFVNRPEHVAVNAVKTWNRLRREVPGWPDIVLTAPRKREAKIKASNQRDLLFPFRNVQLLPLKRWGPNCSYSLGLAGGRARGSAPTFCPTHYQQRASLREATTLLQPCVAQTNSSFQLSSPPARHIYSLFPTHQRWVLRRARN